MIRIILVVALIVRVLAAFWWQGQANAEKVAFRFGDSETYWVLAEKMIKGEPYEYGGSDSRVFRAPLYPLFLAPFTLLPKDVAVPAVRLAGALLGTATVGLVIVATRRLADRRAALCAGWLAAGYPGAIGMSVFVLSEALFCPLMILSLMLWSRGDRRQSECKSAKSNALIPGISSGGLFGLACLTRPSWLLWPIFLLAWEFFRSIGEFKSVICSRALTPAPSSGRPGERSGFRDVPSLKIATRMIAFAVGAVIVMSPWWTRNYVVIGHFVPTTLQVGASLYDGLHENASGASDEGMAFVDAFAERLREERRDSLQKIAQENFEWELNRRLFRAASAWVWENRSDAFGLALIKFQKMWSPLPTAKQVGGIGVRVAEAIAYLFILLLAVLGLAVQRRWEVWYYAWPTLYFAALHLVFASSVRYRQPAMLVLCVVAGIGAAWMLNRIGISSKNSTTYKP
jgi:hypothetical protein